VHRRATVAPDAARCSLPWRSARAAQPSRSLLPVRPCVGTGGLVGFCSARYISTLNARRQAGAALRAAFAKEIASVRLAHGADKSIKIEQVLTEAFPRHAAAIEEYRFFVRPKDQAAYERAWREYYEVGGSVRFFDYYMTGASYEIFEKRVLAILQFY
jgi:hypothetical protein